VAKDLAKMSSKVGGEAAGARGTADCSAGSRADRLEERGEGLGFLLGAALLATAGFNVAVLGMAAVLAVILAAILVAMPRACHRAQGREVFRGLLQVAQRQLAERGAVFLFGARDVWFVVGIPIYFYAVLSDGTVEGNRAAFFMIGTFMAVDHPSTAQFRPPRRAGRWCWRSCPRF
jgi:flagellar biogenesis protein FliO